MAIFFRAPYDVKDLDLYYTNCVIGGPGAFMIPVNDWAQFPEAVRRKLVLELAGPVAEMRRAERRPVENVQATQIADCMSAKRYGAKELDVEAVKTGSRP